LASRSRPSRPTTQSWPASRPSHQNRGKLKVADTFFSNEIYGIGIKKGDSKGVAAVDEALQAMFNDGSWRAALSKELPQVPAEAPPIIGKFDIPFHQ